VLIDYLANHKEFIPEIAALSYRQWTALFQAAGISQEQLEIMLAERAVTDRLPITFVAISDGVLVGTGSIKMAEPGTKAGLSPWLAGIYVKDSHRGSGVGAMIVRALEAKAAQLGVKEMYLSAGAAEGLYARLGWTLIERLESYGVKQVALMKRELVPTLETVVEN
jgi:GNAT superfamily N-acetyltransferase